MFARIPKINNFISLPLQNLGNRFYELDGIRLRNKSIECLKKWNQDTPEIKFDNRFIKLLLLDNFSTHILRNSSVGGAVAHNGGVQHASLNPDRVKFIQGMNLYHLINQVLHFVFFQISSRYVSKAIRLEHPVLH